MWDGGGSQRTGCVEESERQEVEETPATGWGKYLPDVEELLKRLEIDRLGGGPY